MDRLKTFLIIAILLTFFVLVGTWAMPFFNPEEQCTFMPQCNDKHFEVWMTAKAFRGQCTMPDFNFQKAQCEGT